MRLIISDGNQESVQRLKRWIEDYFGRKCEVKALSPKDDPADQEQFQIEMELDPEAFDKAIGRAEDRMINELNASMQVLTGKRLERVFFDQIIYAKSDVRKINLNCTEGEISFYGKMGELETKLSTHGFIRCHKSYLVNMEYVQNIDGKKITLLNGEQIPVSKARSFEAKKQIQQYLDDLK